MLLAFPTRIIPFFIIERVKPIIKPERKGIKHKKNRRNNEYQISI